MKVAIMQPYFFPYLGYFHLLDSVDSFVFFDDVNYIKKGWINKNTIKDKNNDIKFTVPLVKASQNRLIKDHFVSDYDNWSNSFYKVLTAAYSKAPNFERIMHLMHDLIGKNTPSISVLAANSIMMVADYLEIGDKKYCFSSDLNYRENSENGTDKILNICKILKATDYHNAIGGISLYETTSFLNRNIDLFFVESEKNDLKEIYNYSIIDLLMWKSKEELKELLLQYSIVKNG